MARALKADVAAFHRYMAAMEDILMLAKAAEAGGDIRDAAGLIIGALGDLGPEIQALRRIAPHPRLLG